MVAVPDLVGRTNINWPNYTPSALELGTCAVFAFPLQVGAGVVGVLTLYTSLDDFTPRHQKLAEEATLALAPLVAQWTVAVSVRT